MSEETKANIGGPDVRHLSEHPHKLWQVAELYKSRLGSAIRAFGNEFVKTNFQIFEIESAESKIGYETISLILEIPLLKYYVNRNRKSISDSSEKLA